MPDEKPLDELINDLWRLGQVTRPPTTSGENMTPSNAWENMSQPLADNFGDLDSWGREAKAEHVFGTKVEDLPNGDYDFEIVSATLEQVGEKCDRICRLNLRIVDGAAVQWTCWLNEQKKMNTFLADLSAMGFDASRWGDAFQRPLSREIPAAVAKLPGVKFRGHKSSRADNRPGVNRVYQDFRVVCRIDSGRPMPPLGPSQATQTPAPTSSNGPSARPTQMPAAPAPVEDDAPF